MTRDNPPVAYDDDFFAWTQDQAAALRRAARSALDEGLDVAHLATEIEDLGKRDLREVETFLERIVEHLIKLAAQPASRDAPHWRSEVRYLQRSARKAFSPSMRRLLEMGRIWHDGRRAADAYLADICVANVSPVSAPFSLDDLLCADFDIDVALARLVPP